MFYNNVFRKYGRVDPLKDKKDIRVSNAFQKCLDDSG